VECANTATALPSTYGSKEGAGMHSMTPHTVSRRKDPRVEAIKELVALGFIRWTDPAIGPDEWPDNLPLPIELTEKGEAA
jgi:hypothetical protein